RVRPLRERHARRRQEIARHRSNAATDRPHPHRRRDRRRRQEGGGGSDEGDRRNAQGVTPPPPPAPLAGPLRGYGIHGISLVAAMSSLARIPTHHASHGPPSPFR